MSSRLKKALQEREKNPAEKKGDKLMIKEKILKWFLRFAALFQIVYWSLSHLFFPRWYLNSVGMNELAQNPETVAIFMNEIGILTLGVGVATWLLSNKPKENIAIVIMLYIIGIGSISVSLYHVLVNKIASGELITVSAILFQLVVLTVLYPWKNSPEKD